MIKGLWESFAGRKRCQFRDVEYLHIDSMPALRKYCFMFICQKGEIAASSALLAASLKRFVACDYEMIAAVPGPEKFFGRPSDQCVRFLNDMGVRIHYFTNEFVRRKKMFKPYVLYNKFYALKADNDSEKCIFLDSDILCTRTFSGDQRFHIPFNATLDFGGGVWCLAGKFAAMYKVNGLEMPVVRHRVEGFRRWQPALFNTGLMAISSCLAKDFSKEWMKTAIRLEKLLRHPKSLWNTEQSSVPVVLNKMGIPYDVLEQDWMFRIDRPDREAARFFHYFTPENIRKDPQSVALVKSLIAQYKDLAGILEDEESFRGLLQDLI